MKQVITFHNNLIRKQSEAGQLMGNAQIEQAYRALQLKVNNLASIEMLLPTHIPHYVRYLGSPDNFSTDISELLHIENVKEAYQTTNKVNYEKQIMCWNERRLNLVYMDQTLKFLALNRHYIPESARMVDLCHPEGSHLINLTSKAYMLIQHSQKAEHASQASLA